VNEELETSQHELLKSHDCLLRLNAQLQKRSEELARLNGELGGLLRSCRTALVLVGCDLRIRYFTAAADNLFSLIDRDVGRPISDLWPRVQLGDLPQMLAGVIDSALARELDIRDPQGRRYRLLLQPSLNRENRVDGVIIALTDLTSREEAPGSSAVPT
jgi:two-component system CheB/CheR fusion protein